VEKEGLSQAAKQATMKTGSRPGVHLCELEQDRRIRIKRRGGGRGVKDRGVEAARSQIYSNYSKTGRIFYTRRTRGKKWSRKGANDLLSSKNAPWSLRRVGKVLALNRQCGERNSTKGTSKR